MTYKYSVLMSVYKNDSPEFLKIALESIYDNQTRKPDEIVVVFDGPLTSALYSVLKTYREGKEAIVKYIFLKKNKGLGNALRIGSKICQGDYIFRMDSDDVSAPSRFETQIKFIEAHPEVDCVGTDIAEFNHSINEKNKRIRSCPPDHKSIVKMGKTRNPMNHVSVCIKKSALEKCGGYKTLLLLEDYYLWLRMIADNCILANINESLVYVRVGNGFDHKRGAKDRITGWWVLQRFMLSNNMISLHQAVMNMLYINAFIRMPASLKNIMYKVFLRHQS